VPYRGAAQPMSYVVVPCVGDGFGPLAIALCIVNGKGADGVISVRGEPAVSAEGAGSENLRVVLIL
jgi:hypothetical protein